MILNAPKQLLASLAIGAALTIAATSCTIQPASTPSESAVEASQTSELSIVTEDDFNKALSLVTSEFDDFDESTYWEMKVSPSFFESAIVYMVIYTYETGDPETYVVANYLDDDWIFFDTLEVRAGGETYVLMQVESYDKYTDVLDGGRVAEVGLQLVGLDEELAIQALIDDPDAKFRLSGSDGTVEREFTVRERNTFETLFTIHKGLQQGLNP